MIKRKAHPTATLKTLIPNSQSIVFDEFDKLKGEFTYKARTALYDVFTSISKQVYGKKVLVPAFHCPTVVDPIIRAGFDVEYYGINQDLTIDRVDFNSRLSTRVAAVVIINFFGFQEDISTLHLQCKKSNTLVVEDCSHSFFLRQPLELSGTNGDIAVYSFWKMIPSILGGGIGVNKEYLKASLPSVKKTLTTKLAVKYVKLLFEHIWQNTQESFLQRLLPPAIKQQFDFDVLNVRKQESPTSNYPIEPEHYKYHLPWLSKYLIKHTDLSRIEEKVIANYSYLSKAVEKVKYIEPVFKELPERIVPWALPVMVKDRALFDFKLLHNNVSFFTFGEELHQTVYDKNLISEKAFIDAKMLSESILCLSIHQNIGPLEREHTEKALLALFGKRT